MNPKKPPQMRKKTHAFCLSEGAWHTIYQYAMLNHLSFSNALCELVLIAREKLLNDQRKNL